MEKIIFLWGLMLVAAGVGMLAADQFASSDDITGNFVASRTISFPLGITAVVLGGIAALAGSVAGLVRNQK